MSVITIEKHVMQIKYVWIFLAPFDVIAKLALYLIKWQTHARTSMNVKLIYMNA
jgi:hypothetical protein